MQLQNGQPLAKIIIGLVLIYLLSGAMSLHHPILSPLLFMHVGHPYIPFLKFEEFLFTCYTLQYASALYWRCVTSLLPSAMLAAPSRPLSSVSIELLWTVSVLLFTVSLRLVPTTLDCNEPVVHLPVVWIRMRDRYVYSYNYIAHGASCSRWVVSFPVPSPSKSW